MNKSNLALFNRIRRDSLIRSSDDVITLCDYVSRYYGIELNLNDASAIYKALQTSVAKQRAKSELVEV